MLLLQGSEETMMQNERGTWCEKKKNGGGTFVNIIQVRSGLDELI